ncbi:MAG: hypothetical protein EBZ67_15115 [Chitinophagia bacterium]|nr:hypothetical protein [Chitinophagia bacterium]
MTRCGYDTTGTPIAQRMAHTQSNVQLPDSGEATIEIRSDRNKGLLMLFINGQYAAQWEELDPLLHNGEKADDNANMPLGNGFAIQATNGNTPLRLSDMVIIEWNGIKDSACQFGAFSELLRRYPDRASRPGTIMQGDESVYDASLLMGCDGVVTGGGVVFVRLLKRLCDAGMNREIDMAMRLQAEFWKGMTDMLMPNLPRDWMFNIKERLTRMGVIEAPWSSAPFMHNWDK